MVCVNGTILQLLTLQASPVAEEHPQYWAATRRAAALGRTADAQTLLGLHPAFARFGEPRQRELVQPLVRQIMETVMLEPDVD